MTRRGEGKAQAQIGDARCVVCRASFRYTIKGDPPAPPPPICGQLDCRARHTWGPDDWAGRARMAAARQHAGIELNALDIEALRRVGQAAA